MNIKILASGSSGNAYFLGGETPLLLECGMPFQELQRSLDFQVSSLAGCLLSHSHKDHSGCVREVLRAGIDVYAPQGTIDMLELNGHRLHAIKSKEQFSIGGWSILPFDTVHDDPEPLGFLLANGDEKILYATDTCYLRYRFQGLTHILIECNYAEDLLNENRRSGSIQVGLRNWIKRNHMSLETLREFLWANDLSKVRQIYLLHLSDRNSDVGRFKREIQALSGKEIYVAKKRGEIK